MDTRLALASMLVAFLSAVIMLHAAWPITVHHRVLSASPTLSSDRGWILKVHDYEPKRESVIKAEVLADLLNPAIRFPFPQHTVSITTDPWCAKKVKGLSDDPSSSSWERAPIISGTFGSLFGPSKLNLSVPAGLDLSGRDLCVLITTSAPSPVNRAEKANIVVQYDVKGDKSILNDFVTHKKFLMMILSSSLSALFVIATYLALGGKRSYLNRNSASNRFYPLAREGHEANKRHPSWRRRRRKFPQPTMRSLSSTEQPKLTENCSADTEMTTQPPHRNLSQNTTLEDGESNGNVACEPGPVEEVASTLDGSNASSTPKDSASSPILTDGQPGSFETNQEKAETDGQSLEPETGVIVPSSEIVDGDRPESPEVKADDSSTLEDIDILKSDLEFLMV